MSNPNDVYAWALLVLTLIDAINKWALAASDSLTPEQQAEIHDRCTKALIRWQSLAPEN